MMLRKANDVLCNDVALRAQKNIPLVAEIG